MLIREAEELGHDDQVRSLPGLPLRSFAISLCCSLVKTMKIARQVAAPGLQRSALRGHCRTYRGIGMVLPCLFIYLRER